MSKVWKVLLAVVLAAPVLYRLSWRNSDRTPEGRTVVRYMAWGYPSQLGTEHELIKTFEALPENRDFKVDFIMAPMSSYYDKVQLMFASGTAPDVLRVNPDHYRAYIKLGYFKALDELMEADADYNGDDFFEAAKRGFEWKGRRYGLGVLFTTTLVYYNKTIFEEAGVKDPWQRFQEGRWTWDDFLDAARATTKFDDEGRPVQFGSIGLGSIYSVSNIVNGYGGRLVSADGTTSLVNSPVSVGAIKWISDLVWKWKVSPTPAQGALSVFSFESGRIAMEIDSSGESPRLRDAITRFEWDVAPAPEGPKGVAAGYGAHCLVMNADTKAPDAAWRYMKFMTSPVAERLLGVELRRCIPTRIVIAESDEYLSADKPPYNMRAFIARVNDPLPEWEFDDKWGEWSVEWRSHLDRVFLGGVAPQVAMDDAAERINMILRGELE